MKLRIKETLIYSSRARQIPAQAGFWHNSPMRYSFRQRVARGMENFRLRVAHGDAIVQMALLGLITGILTALVIIAFRLLIELGQGALMGAGSEDYSVLPWYIRLVLPLAGLMLFWLIFRRLMRPGDQVGVIHVMERLAYHQGHLPMRNAIIQFFGGAMAIISGNSVGREGPGIHLGAASASQLAQRLGLPNNSIRTLVACGTAAAIAASFNTPLAGVIFAMEVVLMEYTIFGFAPVILAAVAATIITRMVFGSAVVFEVPPMDLGSLVEIPYLIAFGVVIGILAGVFVSLLEFFGRRLPQRPRWQRLAAAGVIAGLCGAAVPEIMGIGYDVLNKALIGELGIALAITLVVAKLVATTAAIGFGVPAGLIGPTLVIGGAAGIAMGIIGAHFAPGYTSDPGFYALLGMATMMGATLQAPLAALISMLELTANPNILLPGMLTVVTAMLVTRRVMRKPPVYLRLMRLRGLDYRNDPVAQSLRRVGVASAMESNVRVVSREVSRRQGHDLVARKPRWLLIREPERDSAFLLPTADLAHYLAENEAAPADDEEPEKIDLLAIPGLRREAWPVHLRATLQEAFEIINDNDGEAVFVENPDTPGSSRVYGVLTREDIESSYR